MSNTIRAFFAVEIPKKQILDNIAQYQEELQKSIGPLKLVNPDKMHITLKFLGNIDEGVAAELYSFMMEKVNQDYIQNLQQPFKIKLKSVGDFRKRVFFVDIVEGIDHLRRIHDILEEKTRTIPGIKQDKRKYTPHITIARNKGKGGRNNPGQILYKKLKHTYEETVFGEWTVSGIVLKKSVLTPQGPIYSNLQYWIVKISLGFENRNMSNKRSCLFLITKPNH